MVQEDLGWAAQAAAPAGNGCEPVSAASSCKKLLDYMLTCTCTKVQAAKVQASRASTESCSCLVSIKVMH